MVTITTEPATLERWSDVQESLSGGGDGRSCQCAWWTLTNAEWNRTTADERRDLLHAEIASGPPPGLVAYVDGEVAGWVRVSPRTVQRRIGRTRNIVATTPEPLDDDRVWAVTCFVVRREHRRTGLNRVLLDAAVELARSAGARVVEGYPIDTAGTEQRSNDLYHGTLSTFLAAGFAETALRKPGRPIVALDLSA